MAPHKKRKGRTESGVADSVNKKRTPPGVGLELQCATYRPTLADVQNLFVRLLTHEYGENPKWLHFRGMHLVRRVVAVVVPCLDSGSVRRNGEQQAPVLTRLSAGSSFVGMRSASELEFFPSDQKVRSPSCRLLRTILGARARPAVQNRKVPSASVSQQGKPSVCTYLATSEERARSGYPMFEEVKPGWISSNRDSGHDCGSEGGSCASASSISAESAELDQKRMIAVDCEMVTTASGPALARVTLVNVERQVIFDSLVCPGEPVTDYLTEFSGITAEKLSGVVTTRSDVQEKILGFISKETILVGHSLENDLQALQLLHEKVVDTALLYPHARGWPHRNGLRGLASQYLKRKLDRQNGHDSAADALAALDLALLKVEKGPGFGVPGVEVVPLGRLLQSGGVELSLIDTQPVGAHSQAQWHFENCEVLLQSSDAEVAAKAASLVEPGNETHHKRKLAIYVLRELETLCESFYTAADQKLSGAVADKSDKIAACIARLDHHVAQIIKTVANDDLLVILSGCGNFYEYHAAKKLSKDIPAALVKNFKDAFGIFSVGGPELQHCVEAPVRELVTYDF